MVTRDDEFRTEVEANLALELDQLIAEGHSPDEARARAHRAVGNSTQIRERFYESRRAMWLEHAYQDIRFSLRSLRRSPGFATVAILTLAIGLGASTAIFNVVNAVLLRPLPYPDPGRLVLVEHPDGAAPQWLRIRWRARAHSVADFAGFIASTPSTLVADGRPVSITSAEVSANFFPLLGVSPAVGTLLTDATDHAEAVVLTDRFWQRQFGADPGVVGRTIALPGERLVIVGVTSATFRFPVVQHANQRAIVGVAQPDIIRLADDRRPLLLIGRLAPASTPASASAELQAIFRDEGPVHTGFDFLKRGSFAATPLQERLGGDTGRTLLSLLGAAGCVLLIVCANVANLLLARTSSRRTEYAIRAALGARTSRLARFMLTESVLLAGLGGLAALLLAQWIGSVTRSMLADRVPHVDAMRIDWWVLLFTALLAATVGVLSGLGSVTTLRSVGVAFTSGSVRSLTTRMALRRSLLAAEVAATFVLVVTAALLSQTVWNLYHSKRGFEGDRILTAGVAPNVSGTVTELQQITATFFSDLTQQIAKLPGVEAAAASSTVPLDGLSIEMPVSGLDRQAGSSSGASASVAAVTPGYFTTLGTRVLAGRDFRRDDSNSNERVAIVNEALRRQIAPDQPLVGTRITIGQYRQMTVTVVGIAEDAPDRSLRNPARPFVYVPLDQQIGSSFAFGRLTILLRTARANPETLLPALRQAVWGLGSDIVIDAEATMNERVAASVRSERDSALLFGLLAGIALLVALAGVYGVVAYSVVQRTREIGVRIALGARHGQVIAEVVRTSAWPVAAGLAVGLCGAVVATRGIAALLFEINPLNPAIFAATALLLATTALTAAWIPARRVARIDPVTALRAE